MLRLQKPQGVLWLIPLVAMLMIRMSGLHEHFCLDGTEPAASIHFSDDVSPSIDGDSSQPQASQPHSDIDVSLLGDALLKKLDASADLSVVTSALLLILFVVSVVVVGFPHRYGSLLHVSGARAHIRPQLRAPPR